MPASSSSTPGACEHCQSPNGRHKPTCKTGATWHCFRCGYDWNPRTPDPERPANCAGCKKTRWWRLPIQFHKGVS
jgi:hypothetical protein